LGLTKAPDRKEALVAHRRARLTPFGRLLLEGLAEANARLEEALSAAYRLGEAKATDRPRTARIADFATVVAQRIHEHRLAGEMTQSALAAAMARAGFDWKRITVAEVEAGASAKPERRSSARRVALEELLALAAIFRVPMVNLLLPDPGKEHVAWPRSRSLNASDFAELVLGRSGRIGKGGETWPVADHVVGTGIEMAPRRKR
jgi:hypothetical protein